MCGRYRFLDEDDVFMNIVNELGQKYPDSPIKMGDIFPTNSAPILLAENDRLVPELSVWGFPKYTGSGVIINARSETAPEKKTFRESLLNRRCLIPSSGFYEWDAQKNKHLFNLPGEQTLYIGGIYKETDGVRRYVILTTEANDSMKEIHSRMPIIVPKANLPQWVFDTSAALNYLQKTMPKLSHT